MSYEKDITPITLSTLNKHPKLKNLYFLQENAKQAIASMSQAQYDAILEVSENNGLKSPFEMVQKPDLLEDEKEETLKPFIMLVVDQKEEGLKAANDLLQKLMPIQSLQLDILIFQKICYTANIYQMKQEHYIIAKVLLHSSCRKRTKVI